MNEKESEDEMANEQDKTAIRGALDYIGRVPMNQRESEALAVVRTEIERAWGEIERQATTIETFARVKADASGTLAAFGHTDESKGLAQRIRDLGGRLSHAHDAASALYRAAVESVAQLEPYAKVHSIAPPQTVRMVFDQLAAAIDPALTAAALAETQRRDGLDGEVKRLTAQVEILTARSAAAEARLITAARTTLTPEQASMARALCPKRTGAEHMTREGSGACIFCGADATPPPEMATTTGEPDEREGNPRHDDMRTRGELVSRYDEQCDESYWSPSPLAQSALTFLRWACSWAVSS